MRNLTLIAASAVSLVLYQIVILVLSGGFREIGLFLPIVAIVGGSTGAAIGALGLGLSRLFRRSTASPKTFAALSSVASILVGMAIYAIGNAGHASDSPQFIWAATFYVTSIAPFALLRVLPEGLLLTFIGTALMGAVTGALASHATNKVHGNTAA
ncbi:MAG: hypothetical protein K2W82_15500 [Candidatus Obscuribacterales bacterium]|nr:hypothetical protein [Candidatus Obscuribacterales bacterium]